ncbi:MAG: hypothetical protein JNL36_01325 [Candidatus Kapabacteria bacterium]|nr:hypothetical protein [Candidatus Kapabacteria bacterium]
MKKFGFLFIVTLLAFCLETFACPNCKNAYAQDPTLALIGDAYNYSIFLMILIPIALIGSITFLVIKNAKKN